VTIEAPEPEDIVRTPIRLTANPQATPVIGSAISPDGKYLVYLQSSGVYLRVIESGETHQIPMPSEMSFNRSGVDWFPDGTHLIVTAYVDGRSSLWKLAIVGGAPKKLIDGAVRVAISPDGSRIAYLPDLFQSSIFMMGADGEQPTRLVDLEQSISVREIGWSPDGKYLLAGAMVVGVERRQFLQAIHVETGTVHTVFEDSRTFQNWRGYLPFHWLTDGRLLYARQELPPNQTMSNLWQMRLDPDSATPIGTPEQITRLTGLNFQDLSATSDLSRVAFLLESNQADVYVGELDNNGTRLINDRRITFDERDDYPGGWSPDGSNVYFHSNRGVSENVFAKSMVSNAEIALTGSLVSSGGNVQQSPDRDWILYWDRRNLYRMPAGGGPSELVLEAGGRSSDFHCPRSLSVGADCVVGFVELENQYTFYAFNPRYGLGQKYLAIDDIPPFTNWALSPDGRLAAVVHMNGVVRILDLRNKSEREYSEEGWSFGEYVDWAADGSGLFMDGYRRGSPLMKSLLHYSLEKREVSVLRDQPAQWHIRPKASPDGKYLAFGLMIFSGNVWMIDDFVSSE
jgi:Tol biopolymer transport system component